MGQHPAQDPRQLEVPRGHLEPRCTSTTAATPDDFDRGQRPAEVTPSGADEEAAVALSKAWDEANNNSDADALLALYAEDAIRMAADEPMIQGTAAIRAAIESGYEEQTPNCTGPMTAGSCRSRSPTGTQPCRKKAFEKNRRLEPGTKPVGTVGPTVLRGGQNCPEREGSPRDPRSHVTRQEPLRGEQPTSRR